MDEKQDDDNGKWAVYECYCQSCKLRWCHVALLGYPPLRCHKCESLHIEIGPGKLSPQTH